MMLPDTDVYKPKKKNPNKKGLEEFMNDDEVYYISEHRKSYDNTRELEDIIYDESDIVLFPISITRFDAEEARKELEKDGVRVSIIHQLWIKPFVFKEEWKKCLDNSKFGGIVFDDDYEQGVASSIAHRMMIDSIRKVYTLGLDHRTAGFHPKVDNLPPNKTDIINKILEVMR